jgi:hypothetical protein
MSKHRVVKRAETFLSPVDVEEFWTVMLDAGTQLASLLVVEYPNAGLVDNALFGVTDVVECYILKGKWVTSWASSAHNDFLATDSVRKVSGCVAFFNMTCKYCVVHSTFFIGYLAGGD